MDRKLERSNSDHFCTPAYEKILLIMWWADGVIGWTSDLLLFSSDWGKGGRKLFWQVVFDSGALWNWTGRHLPTSFKWQPAKFSWDHKGSASLRLSTAVATGRLGTEAAERLARQSQSHVFFFLFWFVSGFWSQLCLRLYLRFWGQAWILSNFASYKVL